MEPFLYTNVAINLSSGIISYSLSQVFSVIIANRQSLSDFIEPITDITRVQANGNYMYMKKVDGKPGNCRLSYIIVFSTRRH